MKNTVYDMIAYKFSKRYINILLIPELQTTGMFLKKFDGLFCIWNCSRNPLYLFSSHDESLNIICNINQPSVDFPYITIFLA